MSSLTKFKKDKLFRREFEKNELKFVLLKYSIYNQKNNRLKKSLFHKFIRRFRLMWSRARIINKCIFSGRNYWNLRKFKLSRMTFRNLCDNGNIHGIRRSSW